MDKDDVKQTPYIPSRIWSYQNRRLEECLKDFLVHKNEIKYLFDYMLDISDFKSNNRIKNH